ncbi:hypothetical protein T09_7781 [Trichinella sp. T9]|nr:hypothetical protein T09_7781 [Trichinella sp. T9]
MKIIIIRELYWVFFIHLIRQRHEGPLTALSIRRCCSLQVPLRQMRNRGKKASHPVQFKNAAGEDRGWLLATDPHDRIRRYPISHCMAGRLVIDQRARRLLMIRWSSKSKRPRYKPLISKRTASRGTVSKTIGDQISVDPPRCPPPAKAFYILLWRRPRGIFYLFFRARVLTDMETSGTCGGVFRECRREDEAE